MTEPQLPEYILVLASKWKDGTISDAEKEEFDVWYNSQENVFHMHTSETEVQVEKRILSAILNQMDQEGKRPVRLWPHIAAAASIVLMIGTGILFYQSARKDPMELSAFRNDIAPGSNGATLTLANGKKISINDALSGDIASEQGVKISKAVDGKLVYEIVSNAKGLLGYNTLSTSRGQQSQVRLPDGTLVFLNAESSLKYPVNFAASAKREVSLSGEGYFEVFKDRAHPFVVKSRDQQVEVLGTHFNIQAYPGDAAIRTTLLEGSVRVSFNKDGTKVLRPSEQLVLSETGALVRKVEGEYEVAWKEGFFVFDNESLESIMQRVALWYNVKVIYEDTSLKKETFLGTVNKFENISKVLRMLEKTDVARFRIERDTILIDRKKH